MEKILELLTHEIINNRKREDDEENDNTDEQRNKCSFLKMKTIMRFQKINNEQYEHL